MARTYTCDGPDCEEAMDEPGIEVMYMADATFGLDDDDDNDFKFEMVEVHFCNWPCLSAFAFAMAAADNPNL